LNILWRGNYAHILNAAGLYRRAIEQAREVIEMDESHWGPPFGLATSYALQGMFIEARELAEKARERAPWNAAAAGLLAGIYARTGNPERADALLVEMKPGGRAVYHTLCSELDLAADWYKKAVEQGELMGLFVSANLLKPLRDSPRWPELARMMNLPASA
jgi:tetratricopeptide (TPR) repeat protein